MNRKVKPEKKNPNKKWYKSQRQQRLRDIREYETEQELKDYDKNRNYERT